MAASFHWLGRFGHAGSVMASRTSRAMEPHATALRSLQHPSPCGYSIFVSGGERRCQTKRATTPRRPLTRSEPAFSTINRSLAEHNADRGVNVRAPIYSKIGYRLMAENRSTSKHWPRGFERGCVSADTTERVREPQQQSLTSTRNPNSRVRTSAATLSQL